MIHISNRVSNDWVRLREVISEGGLRAIPALLSLHFGSFRCSIKIKVTKIFRTSTKPKFLKKNVHSGISRLIRTIRTRVRGDPMECHKQN